MFFKRNLNKKLLKMPKKKTIMPLGTSEKVRTFSRRFKKKKDNTLDLDEKIIKGIYAFLKSPFKK